MENEKLNKLVIDDSVYETRLTSKYRLRKGYVKKEPGKLTAFIPGKILKIFITEGAEVREGDKLYILEAMKMQNTVFAEYGGKVKKIHVNENEKVAKEQLLIEMALAK